MVETSPLRLREGSVSDTHIARCDCETCDGIGHLLGEQYDVWDRFLECPACEGLGYLETASDAGLAYEAYLNDLYAEIVRNMPAAPQPPGQQRPAVA